MATAKEEAMLPELLSLGGVSPNSAGSNVVNVPPPARFRPLAGRPQNVQLRERPYTTLASYGQSEAQKRGLRYEMKMQQILAARLGVAYLIAPYLHFADGGGSRTAIPDGLVLTSKRNWIVEIKSQHMPEAWWQLHELYKPLIEAFRPGVPVTLVEVVASYDPAMPFPSPVTLLDDPESILKFQGDFGVLAWRT